ncbi:hypothetical protein LMH87_000871 [Akanthomyces muscarius]|uniref:J domain-containing protein n=1 Tax=Akanthomyces muscarius TaxID=2231603 RepID=A0A9W8QFW1_AKAMU|nr:hypothetical protein LMH87_000871 [Akanthomyces muscarius]KAJ4155635.1 hypothetical protein LMH87_000871 [Akanthomyces muscarius]
MAALARAAPCPRLFLRSTASSSSPKAPQSASPPPRHARAVGVRTMRCHAASATGLRINPASPSPVPQHQHQQRRSFRCTAGMRQDLAKRNHYERLQVSPAATPGDIKKSFYKLSKAHHPDANRNDPNAAHTFSLLSESYTLLSDPSRRATYDRDVIARLQPSSSATPSHGSYHSAAYPSAGGRPASGLSKRRGTFRGPPPSFYRNGGWGAQTDRRRRAEDQASASSSSSAHYTNYEGSSSGGDAFTAQQAPGGRFHRAEDDVPPHFDKEAHRRTHEKEDERRWARRRRALDEEDVEFEPQASLGAHFAIVLGILGATVLVPVWYLNTVSGKKKSKDY